MSVTGLQSMQLGMVGDFSYQVKSVKSENLLSELFIPKTSISSLYLIGRLA